MCAVLIGCSSSGSSPNAAVDAGSDGAREQHVFGGDRPVSYFRAPETIDPQKPLPLVLLLHGYSAGGYVQAIYLRLEPLVESKQILLVAPDGTPDSKGNRFWNAVDLCCDFDHTGIDDVKYLTNLVDEIAAWYPVDRKRVYLVGHSNGGAMAYRLACDATDKFAAAWVLAPVFWSAPTPTDTSFPKCKPSMPIAVRQVHGTADKEVPYDGGPASAVDGPSAPMADYASAPTVTAAWAAWDGCDPAFDDSTPPIDFDLGVPGAETKIRKWNGCKSGSTVELWTMQGSGHVPDNLAPDLPETIWQFLSAHSR